MKKYEVVRIPIANAKGEKEGKGLYVKVLRTTY
jgi:hypothetical protein